jgi:zinc protease
MAGSISGFSGKNTFGLKADFLARFAGKGLQLMHDILLTPAFDPGETEKIRPELLAHLKQQEDVLPSLTFREFNRILFDGHPYGLNPLGTEEAIRRFSAEDLRLLYKQYARPDRMVLAISGAVKAEEMRIRVERLFGSWAVPVVKGSSSITEEMLLPVLPAQPKIFTLPQSKEQVHLIIGFLGTTMYDPDRYSLEVLDTVLSGQSGRLFVELRDKQSLAYSLSSFAMLGLDIGSFGIYMGTSPANQELALAEMWKQLYRVREEEIDPEELERAKNILIGRYELGLQTHGAQALDMALSEVYGLGQDYGVKYMEAIRAVNGQEVRAAARKYIQPDRYVMVKVGAEAAEGAGDAAESEEEEAP